jgi:Zn finger protein HypA/HybF involved in hydrogenase expression
VEEFRGVCQNPWCKAHFIYTESDFIKIDKVDEKTGKITSSEKERPRVCPKCRSFDRDLSGGVEWKTKSYEGDRDDGIPHQMRYKVTNFK